jgi:hypothetical protein
VLGIGKGELVVGGLDAVDVIGWRWDRTTMSTRYGRSTPITGI